MCGWVGVVLFDAGRRRVVRQVRSHLQLRSHFFYQYIFFVLYVTVETLFECALNHLLDDPYQRRSKTRPGLAC